MRKDLKAQSRELVWRILPTVGAGGRGAEKHPCSNFPILFQLLFRCFALFSHSFCSFYRSPHPPKTAMCRSAIEDDIVRFQRIIHSFGGDEVVTPGYVLRTACITENKLDG